VLKYALNTFCNKHVSVITLTVYATMVPVLTALLSAVFLNTSLWDSRYLGAVPIVTGTLLVTHGRAEATRPRAKEGGLPVP
jgi:drug/metabolite transporter (DMT)-like permease